MASVVKSTTKSFVATLLLASVSTILHGCGGGGPEAAGMDYKPPPLITMGKDDCSDKCMHDAQYGRWHSMTFGHLCLDADANKVFCDCSDSRDKAPAGCVVHDGSSLVAVLDSVPGASFRSKQLTLGRDEDAEGSGSDSGSVFTAGTVDMSGSTMVDISAGVQVSTQARYTESDTVANFCDTSKLAQMHGKTVEASTVTDDMDASDVARDLESKILGDVARELESNNVDKMAKEIFTFYVCARWVPDNVFWDLARRELAAQLSGDVLGGTDMDMAIADMYRKYRFVPMLCSKNLEIFAEKDDVDNTYFRKFKKNTNELAEWLKQAATSPINEELAQVDRTFCQDAPMVSCKKDKSFDGFRKFFGISTEADLTKSLADGFKAFTSKTANGFQDDLKTWKARFPYHSFIAKPTEWDAQNQDSPKPKQRFVVCFGKRVASEMHRRPNGGHILTDQNNIGCHGWYEAAEASAQLSRMVELWKPPTCQLAEMTYVMKKEILAKFQEMNERLFDSLPSQINDELEAQERDQQDFAWEAELPQPYKQGELVVGSRVFVEDMRVGTTTGLCLNTDGKQWITTPGTSDDQKRLCREPRIAKDVYGLARVAGGRLSVKWDTVEAVYEVPPELVQILPHGWKQRKGWHAHARDLVAGVNKISDKAMALFNNLFAKKQQNLANLMSGSVSKWVVCPIKAGVETQLDAQLGVEDEAFKDFQMEAYKSWTGFKKKIPGADCDLKPSDVLTSAAGFEGVRACEINELHADHNEPYTKNDVTMEREQFICPLRPPLAASEQLEILHEKKGACLLHMTGNQRQQYVWHYQGEFPARRQNDRKPNVPQTEFELVKIIKVPGGDITTEVNFGRYCTLEELRINPRFCNLAEVHNDYTSAEDYATMLAQSVAAVAMKVLDSQGKVKDGSQAPLSISASALSESVGQYQAQLANKETLDKVKENAKKAAIWVGENTWDSLRGAGRLLKSSAKTFKDKITDELRGKGRVSNRLEEQHFGTEKAGQLLSALSFQRSLGRSNTSSNAKERFQRYVMTYPCPSFDPARTYAMKKVWSEVAIRLVKEAHFSHLFRSAGQRVLDSSSFSVQIQGNAARFRLSRTEASDSVTHEASVSIKWDQATATDVNCNKDSGCTPSAFCHKVSTLAGLSTSCNKNAFGGADGWWAVQNDPVLRPLLAPCITNGLTCGADDKYYGLKMELFCAPKHQFQATGNPQVATGQTLEACLKEGVQTNARLRSREPWKLYFAKEVVVVARFSAIAESRYFSVPGGNFKAEDETALKGGATQDVEYFKHLLTGDSVPYGKSKTDKNRFLGMRSGAGFPKGTLSEVVFSPEDVLEAVHLIEESYGR